MHGLRHREARRRSGARCCGGRGPRQDDHSGSDVEPLYGLRSPAMGAGAGAVRVLAVGKKVTGLRSLKKPRPSELARGPRGAGLGRTLQLPPSHVARPRPLFPPLPVRAGSVVRVVSGAPLVVPRQIRAGTLAGALGSVMRMPGPPRTTAATSLARRIGVRVPPVGAPRSGRPQRSR